MSARKLIPLEPAGDPDDGPVAFTDVVITLYLEGVPVLQDDDGDPVFEAGNLAESVIGAFALGCAVGVDFPEHVIPILDQTHPDAVAEIIDECREPLAERVAAARAATEPLEPESFIEDLIEAIDQGPHANGDTAQNALSMSFEYGCILAHLERPAAIVVRNAYNRDQEESLEEIQEGESQELPEGPDPFHSVQELAAEVMTAYEADIGFA